MKPIRLDLIDGAILVVYFAFVLGIGFVLKRHMRSSTDFFLSGRLIPIWVAGLAFLSANLGAQEVNGTNQIVAFALVSAGLTPPNSLPGDGK